MESINDVVDHDLENEETQITNTPEKPKLKSKSRVESSFSRALVHIMGHSI
jgi:hypothetical protein